MYCFAERSCVDRKSSDLGLGGMRREYLQTDCAINAVFILSLSLSLFFMYSIELSSCGLAYVRVHLELIRNIRGGLPK